MVTETIVTSRADIANVAADLAGYATFRRIQDNFEEPPRPSLDDVESVAAVLRDSLASTMGQNSAEFVDSEPLSPAFDRYVKSKDAWVVDDWAERNGLAGAGQIRHATQEGRTHQLLLSPGGVRLTTFDARARAATAERAVAARIKRGRAISCRECPLYALTVEETGTDGASGAEIKVWSAKSRVRMMETIGGLSYAEWDKADGTLAMVTLTLPGNWEILVPSGAEFKRMIEKFRRRWVRATGTPWRLLWKLEFQGRGAPHWHALMRVPVFVKGRMFHDWLSETWADVVDASREIDGIDRWGNDTSEYLRHLSAGTAVDFSGKDFSDPRRISMYFLGHSTKNQDGKEYQHNVPELWQEPGKGPGRFWGNPGLDKAVVAVTVTAQDMDRLHRIARKVKRARDWKMNVLREQGAWVRDGKPRKTFDGFAVGYPKPKYSIGITANRTRNRKALAAHQLGFTDVPPAVGIGPVWRVSNLVSVPPVVGIGPANLVVRPWVPQRRSCYAPFSGGQGGFVLVNDGLQLGLDIARAAGPAAPALVDLYRRIAASDPVRARRLIAARLP